MATTRQITAKIINEHGDPWSGGELRFDLYRHYAASADDVAVDNAALTIVLDESGAATFDLVVPDDENAAYLWNIKLPSCTMIYRVAIGGGSPTTLHEL
ncbi:hypothetical protein KC887_07515, partial [Candidatus Kaiserbacteria bacterium]|nr:hypothetical protein [Candidatus Kaiserbacteria bacterium]